MKLLSFILNFYILVLILRFIMTEQELIFNPLGRFTAKLTNPIFKRFGGLKSRTDKVIPLFILILPAIFAFIYNIIVEMTINEYYYFYYQAIDFLLVLFVFSILSGGYTSRTASLPLFLFRIGDIIVSPIRRVTKIKSNKVVIPSIIFVLVVYILLQLVLKSIYFPISFDSLIKQFHILVLSFLITATIAFLDYLFYIILIRVILSWVSPDPNNILVQIVYYISEPFLSIFRRFIPPIGSIDLSALAALLLINFITHFLNSFNLYY